MGVDVTLGLAFLAGFVSFISPCVLPLVPAYIGYMSGRVTQTVAAQVTVLPGGTAVATGPSLSARFSTFLHGLAFVIGFTLVFVVIGVITTAFLVRLRDVIGRLGGVVIIFFGLHFMGVIPVVFQRLRAEKPRWLDMGLTVGLALGASAILIWGITGQLNIAEPLLWDIAAWMPLVALICVGTLLALMFLGGAFTEPRAFIVKLTNTIEQGLYSDTRRQMDADGSSGLFGSFFMGIAFAAGWTPCIGPIFGTILNMAAVTGAVGQAVPLLIAYSLGLGIPFLVAALLLDSSQGILRRLNRHMRKIKLASGTLLVLIGLLVASGQMQSFSAQLAVQFADISYRVEACVAYMGQGQIAVSDFFTCAGGGIDLKALEGEVWLGSGA